MPIAKRKAACSSEHLRGRFRLPMNKSMCGYCLVFLVAMAIISPRVPADRLPPTLITLDHETLVASAVATNPPWNADPSGHADATAAIQQALNDVAAHGGGVVYLSAGRYRIDGALTIGHCVTLRGDGGKQTTLLATAPPGDKPLIDVTATEGAVEGLGIWYTRQSAVDPQAYPFTIVAFSADLRDIVLYNSYNGVKLKAANCCMIDHLVGTALRRGIVAQQSEEFGWTRDIHFSNSYWRDAAPAFEGAPLSAEALSDLDTFTRAHLVGADIGRLDGLCFDGFSADDAALPIQVEKDPDQEQHNVFGFGGVVRDFQGARSDFHWSPWYYGFHFGDVDNVPEAQALPHPSPVQVPEPLRTDAASLIDVTNAPYSAAGDGIADDTISIQTALDAAGKVGGGTVYLPPGKYRITKPLDVPRGVELRGPLGRGKARAARNACSILGCCGKDASHPDTDPALITLEEHAGVRGIEIAYPEQGFSGADIHPYPYSIRGHGAGVWIADIILVNSYLGIDLAAYRCDNHVVRSLWGTVLGNGIKVGAGSIGGHIEQTCFSFGPALESWMRPRALPKTSSDSFIAYSDQHAAPYTFGNCSDETGWGLLAFRPNVHYHFISEDGKACTHSSFWMCMHDVAVQTTLQMDAGEDIKFIGFWATGYNRSTNWLEVSPQFKGPLEFYSKSLQPTTINHPLTFTSDQVHFYDEVSLTTHRTATASASDPGHEPAKADDRNPWTYWQAPAGNWLQVDLGKTLVVNRFDIESAGFVSDKKLNTKEADLYVSVDGHTFRRVGSLYTNGSATASRPVEPTPARYVRLVVTKPGADNVIRVNSFDVFGY